MQEEYQIRLEQEIQRHTSENSNRGGIGSSLTAKEAEDKMISQKKALETAKQMLHQGREEAESPEMDWDYYVAHDSNGRQPQQIRGTHDPVRTKGEGKSF